MLLHAEGLFRLDVTCNGDTAKTDIRNLSRGALTTRGPAGEPSGASIGFGEIEAYSPGRIEFEFSLGSGADRVDVTGMLATLRFRERGTIRLTAQAIVRPSPVP